MGLHIKELKVDDFERVIEIQDAQRDLHAFIAIHNTQMGPGLGGTRIIHYDDPKDALEDVLRLAKGMTYKAVLANTHTGGSKSTLMLPPNGKTRPFLEAYAEAVNYLGGQHICAEDMNCTEDDLRIIHAITPHTLGLPDGGTGDPAPFTAWGVYRGICSTARYLWGSENLEGKTIALQGIGGVGHRLLSHLFWAGANLIVSDLDSKRLQAAKEEFGAQIVSSDEILKVSCDILAPCARGGIINEQSIPLLQCKAIAGAANNQLLEDEDAERLHAKGILYAPDYLINSGGLISVASGLDPLGPNPQKVLFKTNQIDKRLTEIFELAEKNACSPLKAANELVENLLKEELKEKNALV